MNTLKVKFNGIFLLTAILPCLICFPAAGSDLERIEGSLEDYLSRAALNNPGLESAFYRWKAALEKIPQVTALPDPMFSYAYYVEQVETRVGPQRHKLGISQKLPWFGTLRLKGDSAAQTAEMARTQYESSKLTLFYDVKTAYYDLYYLGRALEITRENIEWLKLLESVSRTRYHTGGSGQPEILRIQIEIDMLEDYLRMLEDRQIPVTARLKSLINDPVDTHIPIPSSITDEMFSSPKKEIFDGLAATNPSLQNLDIVARKAAVSGELARKARFPDLTFGVDYIVTGSAVNPDVSGSGNDPVLAGFRLNLPVWTRKYRAAEKEADYAHTAAVMQREALSDELAARLETLLFEYRDSLRKKRLYRDALIPKAEHALNVIQQSFIAGNTGLTDVIEAQQTLLSFSLSYEKALVDKAVSIAGIEMLTGEEIPRNPAVNEENEISTNNQILILTDEGETS